MSEQKQVANDAKRVRTGEMILSYPFFITPQIERDDDGNPKPGGRLTYSGAFIGFGKTPEDTLKQLKEAAYLAATERWGDAAKKMIEEGDLRWPFRKNVTAKKYDKVGGLWFFSARSQKKPGLVHRIPDPSNPTKPLKVESAEMIEKLFYPGAHVRATVRAFPYDKKGKGVGFSLDNVQWLADGERLDNRVSAEDDFDADLNSKPADIDSLL